MRKLEPNENFINEGILPDYVKTPPQPYNDRIEEFKQSLIEPPTKEIEFLKNKIITDESGE